jgi:hypothetical protein
VKSQSAKPGRQPQKIRDTYAIHIVNDNKKSVKSHEGLFNFFFFNSEHEIQHRVSNQKDNPVKIQSDVGGKDSCMNSREAKNYGSPPLFQAFRFQLPASTPAPAIKAVFHLSRFLSGR